MQSWLPFYVLVKLFFRLSAPILEKEKERERERKGREGKRQGGREGTLL